MADMMPKVEQLKQKRPIYWFRWTENWRGYHCCSAKAGVDICGRYQRIPGLLPKTNDCRP
ncbi:MAG: hypothetical protein ACLSCV_04820 [Acutalibacteraceae bacterium]